MGIADSDVAGDGQAAPDLLVVGAGIAGLWLSLKAARAGLSVTLIERSHVGAGASGGFLGALMPHSPDRWNGKKDFQFRALVDLETEIAQLEQETGHDCGYRRVGRLLPLATTRARENALGLVADARSNWANRFRYDVAHTPDKHDWPSILWASHGIALETLSARLSPPALIVALAARLAQMPNVRLVEGVALKEINRQEHVALLSDGTRQGYGHIALANGVDAFAFIAWAAGVPELELGGPVKGQAAMLDADAPPDLPLIYYDGVYIIAHDDGRVAVGSTSERSFEDPTGVDENLDMLVKRARKLCPLIRHADIVERWAHVRPRAVGRDPMLGPVPGADGVLAMAGGFKISFGIAHRMADGLIAQITGAQPVEMPESFSVAHHIATAKKSTPASSMD